MCTTFCTTFLYHVAKVVPVFFVRKSCTFPEYKSTLLKFVSGGWFPDFDWMEAWFQKNWSRKKLVLNQWFAVFVRF
jgi:hypothetical protein